MSTVDVKPTNRKPTGKAESPAEPFKRALASCTRAMAHRPDLEVAFAADKPSLVSGPEGARARLPEPPRKPNAREAAILRGVELRRPRVLIGWTARVPDMLARVAPTGHGTLLAKVFARSR